MRRIERANEQQELEDFVDALFAQIVQKHTHTHGFPHGIDQTRSLRNTPGDPKGWCLDVFWTHGRHIPYITLPQNSQLRSPWISMVLGLQF